MKAWALVLSLLLPGSAWAAPCTLMEVKDAAAAELKVYFTKFPKEDTTQGAYKDCKVVRTKGPGTKTFVVIPFRQDANLVVHRDNWPG